MKIRAFVLLMLITGLCHAQDPNYLYRPTRERTIATMPDSSFGVPAGAFPRLATGGSKREGQLFADTLGGGRGLHHYMNGAFRRVVDSSELADTAAALRLSLGSSNTSLGTGHKVAVDATNSVKSLKQKYGITLDSATTGEVGIKADTATLFAAVRSTIPASGSSFTFNDSLKWNDSRAFGLVGDGTTDNITAGRAMRQAAASNGWPIVFAPGIYYFSDSITFYRMTVIGHNATIKTTSTTVTVFNLADSNEVYGFKFIGTGIAAALPGGVFTTQDGIRIFGNKNRVHDNWFTSLNGSGINIWAGSCCGYRNVVYGNTFISNTIGIFAMTNSEYLDAWGNKGELNFVGIYDRSSSNNRWWGNEFSYSIHSNFRLLGSGDHGGAWNNTFNHGNQFNVYIESCTLNYDFGNNICYTGNIAFGSAGVVNNFNWHGGTVSGATITQTSTNVSNVYMHDFIEGSTANTYSATGVIYENILNNTTMPKIVGGALAGSSVVIKSTEGAGTATGVAVSMTGGTDGATTLWQIANNGNIGSGFAPTSGFKQIIKSLGTGSGTVHTLWRNASDQAILQASDLGDIRLGNQSLTTSVNNLYNKNYIGGAASTTPTAWAHLSAGTTTVSPLKFTSGTNLTTTEAGAVEYDGTHLYFTASNGGTRFQLDQQGGLSNPLTTTGDIIYSSSGSTAARRGIGSSGQFLGINAGVPEWRDITSPNSSIAISNSSGNIGLDLTVVLSNGVYTPTATEVTNGGGVGLTVASVCQYIRVGNTVTVSGEIDIDPASVGVKTEIRMSLPFASNFTAVRHAGGAGADTVNDNVWAISANATADEVYFTGFPNSGVVGTVSFSFTYQIL